MPSIATVRAFALLWWSLGALLLILSLNTVLHWTNGATPDSHHIFVLAGVEAISAALFLIPRTQRAGAIGLVVTLLAAFALHALQTGYRWDLVVYAIAVAFVALHGPIPVRSVRRVQVVAHHR
ncbi:MAG: hypothetical protein HZB43_07205 [candidate division Zixibacteria bacterium]|nr:hypothetical protein [candidate division Zixibacteria bacterium]